MAFWAAGVQGWAAAPTIDEALRLQPVQNGIEYDKPAAEKIAKSTIKAEKIGEQSGWVVRDADGQILRAFIDTDGDNKVDQWSYYHEGIEIYRDIDADHNKKADQYRWLNTAGGRWGMDQDEDGRIDTWKEISAEEATEEAILAIAHRDAARFARVLLTAQELEKLGLGEDQKRELAEKLKTAASSFKSFANRQKVVTEKSIWGSFVASHPCTVPAGTNGATKDIVVYENVYATIETGEKSGQVPIGTLVRVESGWRLIDLPPVSEDGQLEAGVLGFFVPAPGGANRATVAQGNADGEGAYEKALGELQTLDEAIAKAEDLDEQAKLNADRSDLLERIATAASNPEDRNLWLRNLADHISAAAQADAYPDGVEKLTALAEKLAQNPADEDLAGYYEFQVLSTRNNVAMQQPGSSFPKLHAKWLEELRAYVEKHPKGTSTPEALLQLAMAEEFADQADEAKKWYSKLAETFPDSPHAAKAAGAVTRLESVGKEMQLKGTTTAGKSIDVSQFRKRVVLIHYWASNSDVCVSDLPKLKDLQSKYGRDLGIIGVSLDSDKKELDGWLKKNPVPWPQVYEPGGLDSRLANEMGIMTMPSLILVDQQGSVVKYGLSVSEIDSEIKALLSNGQARPPKPKVR